METRARDWVEEQVQKYRQQMEEVMAKRRSGQLKTLSDMEEEVSRVNQQMGQCLLEEMLALKKTTRRKGS